MKLGYACKNSIYGSNKRITVRKLSTYTREEQEELLINLTIRNLENTLKILQYNVQHDIYMFRMSQNVFPVIAHEDFLWFNPFKHHKILEITKEIGLFVTNHNIRFSLHPTNFCNLTTSSKEVLQRSLIEINFCGKILDTMGIENADIILHCGGKYGDAKGAISNFSNNLKYLTKTTRKFIRLENDQHIYNSLQTYLVCLANDIPMVLDVAHYRYNNSGESLDEIMDLAKSTWNNGLTPKLHISSQKRGTTKHAHADFIDFEDISDILYKDFDIMIEAKATDIALLKLKNDINLKKKAYVN